MPRRKLILALLFLVVAGAAVFQVLPRPARDPLGPGPGPMNAMQHQRPVESDLPPWAQGANDGSTNPSRTNDKAGSTSSTPFPYEDAELSRIRASPLFNTSSKLADMVLYRKFPELSAADIDRYLAENQRSPLSLLVASHLTTNPALLEEAAAAAPDDPLIQLELAWSPHDLPGKASAIQALAKADPGNSLKDFLWARWQFEQGDNRGALRTLELAGQSSPKLDTYTKRMTDAIAGAYQSSGLSEPEAYYAALWNTCSATRRRFTTRLFTNLRSQLSAVQESGEVGGLLLAARIYCLNGSRSLEASAHTFTDALSACQQESKALSELPGNTPLDARGETVSARLQRVATEIESLRLLRLGADISTLGIKEKRLTDYLRVFKASGEREAQRWLREPRAGSPNL